MHIFGAIETLVLEFSLLHADVFSGKKKIRKKQRPPRALLCGQKAVSVL